MATDIPAPLLIPTDQLTRLTLGLSAGWKKDLYPEITAVLSNTTVASHRTEALSKQLEPHALQVLYTSIAQVAAQAVATGRVLTDASNERRTSTRKRKRIMDAEDEQPLGAKRARMRTNSSASAKPPLPTTTSKRKQPKHMSSITLFRTDDNALTADAAKYCTWQLYFHIANSHLRLAYRDRDAVLHSHKIDIRKRIHFEQFIAICIAHSRLPQQTRIPSGLPILVPPRERLSLLQRIGSSETTEDSSLEGTTIRLDKGGRQVNVKLGQVISDEELLFGRETYVCHATSEEWPGKNLVVKLYWQKEGSKPEDEVLSTIRAKAVKNGALWVLDHLQDVLLAQEVNGEGDDIMRRVQDFLCTDSKTQKQIKKIWGEYRKFLGLRVVVQELLFPVTTLPDAQAVRKVFTDTLKVHKWIFDNLRLLHRDISFFNMMYREAPDGTVLGVLIDFEMAWDVRDLEDGCLPNALQGTGQQPFRALDIAKDKTLPHQYRYDLEAFVYSLLFLVGRYDFYATPQPSADGRDTTLQMYCDTLLDWWDQPEAAVRKEALILAVDDGRAKDLKMLEPLSGFKAFRTGLRDMVGALSQGYLSRALALKEGEHFDDATLGGRVTYDRILAAMDQ